MYQTSSARTYVESFHSEEWERRRIWIDKLFFWEKDHCRKAWEAEVNRAIKTIQRNNAITEFNKQNRDK